MGRRSEIEKRIEDFIIGTNISFPLAIIANELLTNAVKHAFTVKDNGLIKVSASKKGKQVTFTFEDNGVGITKVKDEEQKGFGLTLIGLLTEQLKGSYKIENTKGTKFIIEFEI